MNMKWGVLATLLITVFAGCLSDDEGESSNNGSNFNDANGDGIVVIAVVDGGVNPYHWDMLADKMPQALDGISGNELPLTTDPSLWVPGLAEAKTGFKSFDRVDLTLTPNDPNAVPADLHSKDSAEWAKVTGSSADSINYRWFPGTKVIGLVSFAGDDGWAAESHGVGTSSVSVGNIHGSCPNCLLVFINGYSEAANRWVEEQSWIDAQTNSWGYSQGLVVRDRFYAGSDVQAQKAAVERGQAIFFSAGNGLANAFTATNPTLFSSQEGPDWIITVGAISPADDSSYSGHGKPADISNLGSGYPSAGGATVTANSTFGGTSNATPVTAGLYGETLYRLRAMFGTAPVQMDNVIVKGTPGCGAENAECALADGLVTYQELRDALYEAAAYANAGYNVGATGTVLPMTENSDELMLMAEGHGSFHGKFKGIEAWDAEINSILAVIKGDVALENDPLRNDWNRALSYCTQAMWGSWDMGWYQGEIPGSSPAMPVQTYFVTECPTVGPALVEAARVVTQANPLN